MSIVFMNSLVIISPVSIGWELAHCSDYNTSLNAFVMGRRMIERDIECSSVRCDFWPRPKTAKKKTPGEERVHENRKAEKAKSKEADVNMVINHVREVVNTKLK